MQKLQLYIGTQRVELFKDESVSLTQTIKNLKDIAKIFTEFTKTFSVPASKKNNKIFSHYYNFHINSPRAFDARQKVNASLQLNDLPFKTGKIKLEGVDLKNNLAHTYRITFFGNTVDLKDILGDRQLSSLTSLNTFNQIYNYANIKSKIQTSTNSGSILVPLITHTTRMFYNSNLTGADGIDGNVFYDTVAANRGLINGINWNEFKYAIRVQSIIDAIQSTYPEITFSSDFFNKTYPTNSRFTNLFMWLHRKKGGVETPSVGGLTFTTLTDLVETSFGGTAGRVGQSISGGLSIIPTEPNVSWTLDLKTIPTETNFTYSVRITNTANQSTFNFGSFVGAQSSVFIFPPSEAGIYTLEIESSQTINFPIGGIEWEINIEEQEGSNTLIADQKFSNSAIFTTTPDLEFVITQQIPKMKIIDFLSGLFKMFNLVAYVNDDIIVVTELDDYLVYNVNNPPINIDQYLDTTKSQVDVALPFSSVNFRYKGLGTFLAKQYEQLNNSGWGSENYSLDTEIYDAPSDSYKIELPFEHMLYERLTNAGTNALTTIQFGYFVDDNQESYYGEPLLFYPILQEPAGDFTPTPFAFKNTTTPVTVESINKYFIPSNSLVLNPSVSKFNINFHPEANEYLASENPTLADTFTDTLFETEYKTYMQNVFNVRRRLTKVTAYLPMKIYYNLELNDTIQLGQNNYWINSLTTDLTTGKTKFELLNKLQAEPQPQ